MLGACCIADGGIVKCRKALIWEVTIEVRERRCSKHGQQEDHWSSCFRVEWRHEQANDLSIEHECGRLLVVTSIQDGTVARTSITRLACLT